MKPEDFDITKYKFNPDGILDVFEDIDLEDKHLTELPFNFGKVEGRFFCSHNYLTSLKGLNLNEITGKIYAYDHPDLKLTEKEQLWATLNPGRLILK